MKPVDYAAIDAALGRHPRAVFQLSGGKDSLATLFVLRPFWDRLTVAWLNTGDAPQETVALMAEVCALVPVFLEVDGNVAAVHAAYGQPVDLVPAPCQSYGTVMHPEAPKLQSRYDCCARALWAPMQAAVDALGATLIIRGQKDADELKPNYRSGMVDEAGREVLFPIQHWSEQDVLDYLTEIGIDLPAMYRYGRSNIDCLRCTAYLSEFRRGAYVREQEPEKYADYRTRLITVMTQTAGLFEDLVAEVEDI